MSEEKNLSGTAETAREKARGRFAIGSASRRRFSRYGPLILWAILIFIGSGNVLSAANTSIVVRVAHWLFPQASDATLANIHFIVRKCGHLTEYGILGLLAARMFLTSSRELFRVRWFWWSLLLVVVYALGDEFHQSFIPSRTGSIYDSMIDTVGGLIALVLLAVRTRSRPKQASHRNL